jgi:hypothetical protein
MGNNMEPSRLLIVDHVLKYTYEMVKMEINNFSTLREMKMAMKEYKMNAL